MAFLYPANLILAQEQEMVLAGIRVFDERWIENTEKMAGCPPHSQPSTANSMDIFLESKIKATLTEVAGEIISTMGRL